MGRLLQALLLGQVAEISLDHLGQLVELLHVARFGVLGQGFHVDDADLRGLGGFFKLLQQAVDLLQLFLDFQGLRHGHRRATGELVLGRQLVDLVLVAQPVDQLHQLPGKGTLFVFNAVPEPLDVVELFLLHRPAEALFELARRFHRPGQLAEVRVGLFFHLLGFVGLKNLSLPFAEQLHEGLEAGAKPGNLAGIELDGLGELLFGKLAHAAVGEHVLHRPGNHVRRRLRRAGELLGVVALISMDDAADGSVSRHVGPHVISYTMRP